MSGVSEIPEPIHLILVLVIMLTCGLAGGMVNYWGDDLPKEERHPLLKRLSAGVAAALVVPLFLNMISSSLLKDSRLTPISLFIFAGFCIIAAISSKAFIDSITKKLITKVDQIENDQERLKNETNPIIAAQIEPSQIPLSGEDEGIGNRHVDSVLGSTKGATDTPLRMKVEAFGTDGDAKKVIEALGNGKYTWRYLFGIREETNLQERQVKSTLDWLVDNGLAATMMGRRGQLWGLSEKGRTVFSQNLTSTKSKDVDGGDVPT